MVILDNLIKWEKVSEAWEIFRVVVQANIDNQLDNEK